MREADARAAQAEALRRDVAQSAAQLAAAWRALEAVQRGAARSDAASAPLSSYSSFPEPNGASPPAAQAAQAAADAVMQALRPAGEARYQRNGGGTGTATSSAASQRSSAQPDKDSTLLADVRASLRQLELERASRTATLQSQQALLSRLRSSTGMEPPAPPLAVGASPAGSSMSMQQSGSRGRIPEMLASPATPASSQRLSPAQASSAASSSMARIGRGQYE